MLTGDHLGLEPGHEYVRLVGGAADGKLLDVTGWSRQTREKGAILPLGAADMASPGDSSFASYAPRPGEPDADCWYAGMPERSATVVGQLRAWQAAGGPDLWCRALDRVIRALRGPLDGCSITLEGVVLAEGAAGVATACYILAAEQGIAPDAVTTADIDALYGDTSPYTDDRRTAWEQHLSALGHDVEDASDPVVRVWQIIAHNHRPPPGDHDDTADSLTRWGPGYTVGRRQLSSRVGIRF